MGNIRVVHIGCGGPAIDDDQVHPDSLPAFLTSENFSVTCLTCLDEITDRSEIELAEYLNQ